MIHMTSINNNIKKYYIFGAHSRGQTMAVYLSKLYPNCELLGYMVDNDESNPSEIEGTAVVDIRRQDALDTDARVYVATRSVFYEHIFEVLRQLGFTDIVPVDVALDNKLRNDFVREYFKEENRFFTKIQDIMAANTEDGDEQEATIYVVRSGVDSELETNVDLTTYEKYIQAGRELSDTDLDNCNYFDNVGDNISSRNRQMCELTAMYWIWKNAEQDVVGIEHYRRRFILPLGWQQVFSQNKADVILPVPLYVRPSLKENYVSRHIGDIWGVMMKKLGDIHGIDCALKAKDFFENTGCYSPCNMLIAKKNVYDEMCEWLFPILFAVMEECGEVEDKYQNRYPGFLSERLISFFFFLYQDKYKAIYADKKFLK